MKQNYQRALQLVLKHEGGFVDHPRDPGGATNKGVTQGTYNDYRKDMGRPIRSVRAIGDDEVADIYRTRFWDVVRGDELPSGIDYCVFDFAVNSGPSRAARFLQEALDVTVDGKIGPVTVAAAQKASARAVINEICSDRMAFLRALNTFTTFGKGWTRRVQDVRKVSLEMASAPVDVNEPAIRELQPTLPVTDDKQAAPRTWRDLLRAIWNRLTGG